VVVVYSCYTQDFSPRHLEIEPHSWAAICYNPPQLINLFACPNLRESKCLISKPVISYITGHHKVFFVLFHQTIKVYRCLRAWMHRWICAISLRLTYTRLITSWVETRLLDYVKFSNSHSFKSIPHLNILTVPNWLTVKFHCSLIGSKFDILNTLFLLAHVSNTVARLNSYEHPHVSYWSSLSLFLPPPPSFTKLLYKFVTIACPPKTKLLI